MGGKAIEGCRKEFDELSYSKESEREREHCLVCWVRVQWGGAGMSRVRCNREQNEKIISADSKMLTLRGLRRQIINIAEHT